MTQAGTTQGETKRITISFFTNNLGVDSLSTLLVLSAHYLWREDEGRFRFRSFTCFPHYTSFTLSFYSRFLSLLNYKRYLFRSDKTFDYGNNVFLFNRGRNKEVYLIRVDSSVCFHNLRDNP